MQPFVLTDQNIRLNFRYGYNITSNFPTEIDNHKIQVIFKEHGIVQDHLYLKNGFNMLGNVKFYVEWDAEAYMHVNGEMTKVWENKFSLENKDVIFDLFPRENRELDVWLEYLKFFQQKTKCNLFLWNTNPELQNQSYFEVIDNERKNAFAVYRVSWDEDKYVNPFGVNLNPYDLINGCLLRIDI